MPKNGRLYTMIVWHQGVDDPVETVWRIAQSLAAMDLPIRYAAREPCPLDTRDAVRELVEEGYGRKGDEIDDSMGSRAFNLLTAPPGENPVSLHFTTGARDPRYIDSYYLRFRADADDMALPIALQDLDRLFREWVSIIRPFWGAIIENNNQRRILGSDQGYASTFDQFEDFPINLVKAKEVPQIIHWYNYFGPAFIERLGGAEKLLRAPIHLAERLEDGILWVLQPELFDDANPQHRARQEAASEYLDLPAIHQSYMKKLPKWPRPKL